MYQSHWGLRQSPFRSCLDPQSFYQSPTHDEALARLHFLVDEHRRLGLLMGPAGSGKSLLSWRSFARQLRRARPAGGQGEPARARNRTRCSGCWPPSSAVNPDPTRESHGVAVADR